MTRTLEIIFRTLVHVGPRLARDNLRNCSRFERYVKLVIRFNFAMYTLDKLQVVPVGVVSARRGGGEEPRSRVAVPDLGTGDRLGASNEHSALKVPRTVNVIYSRDKWTT